MITSKQRAYLRGLANGIDAILQIGKNGINDNLIKQVSDALEAREIIKISVLETALMSAKEAAIELGEKTHAEIVQCIGLKLVLYKQAREKENRKIELPKAIKK